MSTLPLNQQPPRAVPTAQQFNNYNAPHYSSHSSVGPFIAVLVVIIILGVLAGMIGRLCSGKRIMGYGQYDMESWAERNFSSCIDGTLSPPLPRPPIVSETTTSVSTPMATPAHQEEREQQLQEEERGHSSANQPTQYVVD